MERGLDSITLYLELYQRGFFKNNNSVVDIGSQEILMLHMNIMKLIATLRISHDKDARTHLQYLIPLSRELLDSIDYSKISAIEIAYSMQKQTTNDFHNPYQGLFLSHNQGHYGYFIQFLPLPPRRTYFRSEMNPLILCQ